MRTIFKENFLLALLSLLPKIYMFVLLYDFVRQRGIFIFLMFLVIVSTANAHETFIVSEGVSKEHPLEISHPETAKAFYGELRGEENWYVLVAKEKFAFPFDILVPDKEDAEKVSAELLNGNKQSLVLFDGENSLLKRYYHDALGGGYYLKGVGYGRNLPAAPVLPAGVYYIRVFNAANQGKYSLVLGTHNDHPLKEALSNLFAGFYIKYWFFGKKSLLLDVAIVLLTLGVLVAILVQIVKRLKGRMGKSRGKVHG